jgi:hypothetical protein
MKNESLNRLMQEMSKKKTLKKNTKDIIIDPMGQWAHPGKNTRIPSSQITMQGVPYPVRGIDNNGYEQMMYPNQEYNFPGADYVDEFPQLKNGGSSKSIVCPNCGWSWNVDKGDPDPFLCHKCGEMAKMQGGGQYGYPQYQDGTSVKKQLRDIRTLAEKKADDAKALYERSIAQQAFLQQASSPINDERRRQLNERYAQQSGKRYNPTTGNVEDRFTPQQDRMLNRAYENIVEPMIDAEMYASATAPLVGQGAKVLLKGAKNASESSVGRAFINALQKLPPGAVKDNINGLRRGIIDIKKGRPFAETFPITRKQRLKVEAAQDKAFNEGIQFVKDWNYPEGGFYLRPEVEARIENIYPDLYSYPTNTNASFSDNPIFSANNLLVNSKRIPLIKNPNVSKRAKDFILSRRGDIGGVNMNNESITLRNHGFYYIDPETIKDVAAHELGHSMQKLGNRRVPGLYTHDLNWGNQIATISPDYKYYIANERTPFGKEMGEAMVKPVKGEFTWEASPLEPHSELMAARMKAYDFYKNQLGSEQALIDLQNPDDELTDWLIGIQNLHRFFEPTTSQEIKRKIIRALPAAIPTVGIGAAALQQQKQGGLYYQQGGLWNKNKSQWVDSVNNANLNKDFVQRFYSKNNPPSPIHIPGTPQNDLSTHYMSYDKNRVYPTVVNINNKLQYLSGNDAPWDYADSTGEYINFNTPEQAEWYASNGYKKGKNVLNSIKNGKAYNNPKYQQGGRTFPTDNTNTGLQSKVLQQIKAKDFFNNKANEQIYLLQKAGYSEAHAKRAIKNKEKKAFDILEKINNDNYRIQMHPDYDPNKSVDEQSYLLNDNSLRARLLRGSNMMTNTGYPIQDFASSLITSPGRSFANMTTDANNKYFNSNSSGLENFANFAGDAVNVFPSIIPRAAGALGQVPNVMAKGAKNIKNVTVAKALSTQLKYAKPKFNNELPKLGKRIDPINRSTVNMQNDFISQMTPEEYDDFMNYIYQNNERSYNRPLIDFKGSRPNSYIEGIGSNEKEGLLFKEKFCLPGSECAKSANAVTNKMYTDITGNPFDASGNAHNAWHMEDQMTRHGGVNINGADLKVGDRILMGNGVNQSTYVPGYTADPRVRHAGVFAGLQLTENGPIPMIFESGKNNAMYLNPLNFTFTGENTALEAIRPQQFINDDFGKSLVNKNIRYAFRDKPSVATYNSNNKKIQSLLTEAEKYRETIKKTHDITNDEFDELLNNVVSVGAQETKLNGALPGSKLSKAKILLQNKLNDAGLLKPIKQTLNATKNILKNRSNSNLPSYPGSSKLEMEAVLYANENNIPFDEALTQVKSKYQEKPKFTVSTVEPSKGMFRQKYQTELDRLSNFGKDLKNKNDLENAIGQMSSNFNAIKKAYPNLSPRETIDLTTLMWNSPGKAMDKELVDFYLLGKNNPDINKYNFDYIRKVNDYKDKYINIKPRLTEPHYEFSRNGRYPEIQYQKGGEINYSDLQNINNNNMRKGGSTYNAGVWYQDGGTSQQDQQQEQMVQQIAKALQQGTNPQKIVEALMQNGIDAEQAKGIVSAVMQQLQGQTPMAQDGEYVSEEMYAFDPELNVGDYYKTFTQNNDNQQTNKKSDFSVVNYLNSIGQKSDFSTRKSLAKIYGIDNYTGTAKQNIMLAEKIKRDQVKSNKIVASEPKKRKGTVSLGPLEKITRNDYYKAFPGKVIIDPLEKITEQDYNNAFNINNGYNNSRTFNNSRISVDEANALNARMMANQPSLGPASSPINDERRRQMNEQYARKTGKKYNPVTGVVDNRFPDNWRMNGGNIPNYMKEGNPMYNFGGYFPQGPRFDYGGQYLPYPYMNDFIPNLSEMKEGGIHIAPSKRGTFTAAATKHGKSVQGFASQVLANKENYSPAMVKKANFARNASKWKHESGGLVAGQVLDVTPDMLEQLKAGGYTFEIIND